MTTTADRNKKPQYSLAPSENEERIRRCNQTAESAQRAVDTSRKLQQEARDIMERVRATRRKIG